MLDYRGMTPNEALAVLDACAWNTRAPILSAEEMEMFHGKENP